MWNYQKEISFACLAALQVMNGGKEDEKIHKAIL